MSQAISKDEAKIQICMEVTPDEAEALAQLAKRFSWETAKNLSNGYDGGRERDLMIDAVCVLSRALKERGFAPR